LPIYDTSLNLKRKSSFSTNELEYCVDQVGEIKFHTNYVSNNVVCGMSLRLIN